MTIFGSDDKDRIAIVAVIIGALYGIAHENFLFPDYLNPYLLMSAPLAIYLAYLDRELNPLEIRGKANYVTWLMVSLFQVLQYFVVVMGLIWISAAVGNFLNTQAP